MKKIIGKNQVVITALAVMIAVAGYLSVTQDKPMEVANMDEEGLKNDVESGIISDVASGTDEIISDDVVYDISDADSDLVKTAEGEESDGEAGGTVSPEPEKEQEEASVKETGVDTAGEAVLVSSTIGSEYFDAAKLSREQTRSKNKEILMEIVNSSTATEAQKEKAVGEVIELTSIMEKETAAETMLEAKGFGNSIVSIVDGKADVIVNANDLTEKDIAQIEDVVKRKTDITAENIVITPVGVSQE